MCARAIYSILGEHTTLVAVGLNSVDMCLAMATGAIFRVRRPGSVQHDAIFWGASQILHSCHPKTRATETTLGHRVSRMRRCADAQVGIFRRQPSTRGQLGRTTHGNKHILARWTHAHAFPLQVRQRSLEMAESAAALLVLGSSLQVAMRLATVHV